LLLAFKESLGFTDLSKQEVEILEIGLDFRKREINEHTSDLGGVFFTSNSLNVVVDELSNLVLIVYVLRNHCRYKLVAVLLILKDVGRNVGVRLHHLLLRRDAQTGLNGRSHLLRNGGHSHVHLLHARSRLGSHNGLRRHGAWSLVVLSLVRASSILSVLVVHVVSSVEVASVQVHHDELNNLVDFWSVKQVEAHSSSILLDLLLEISLVLSVFLLDLSYFLELVVVDVESLAVKALLGGIKLGKGSVVW
jgi:hypothetical protein